MSASPSKPVKTGIAIVILFLLGSLAWGLFIGSQDSPPRPKDLVVTVDQSWYDALPADPLLATKAYLARVPSAMRERGEAVSRTSYVVLAMRILVLTGSVALILFTGLSASIRSLAQRLTRRQALQDAIYALLFFAALFALNLPVETYAGFIRLHQFGFSDESYLSWLSEQTINSVVLTSFYVVGVVLFFALIRRKPATWTRWALAVYVSLTALYVLIAPVYIEPLINHFEPMQSGPEKEAILSLARANGVNDADVFVSDASKQSRLLNAHVSGFWGTARIVLDDNTLLVASPASSRFVMAHELGHYVLNHQLKWVIFDGLVMVIGFAFIAWGMRGLVRKYGLRWQVSEVGDIAALPTFWYLFVLFGFLALPANNWFSRTYESEADLFGLNASRQPHGMAEFMIHDADTSRLDPSTLDVALFYTHPSEKSRIETAMRWRAEQMSPSKK